MSGYLKRLFAVFLAVSLLPAEGGAQRRLVKILVSTPEIEYGVFRPVAEVMAGSIIRELKRTGGMELLDPRDAEKRLAENGVKEMISSRELALEAGKILGADIVIYSTLRKSYDDFLYTITFLEVDRNVIQRRLKGKFRVSSSPAEIGRFMKEETEKLVRYVPLPSELDDFGSVIREETVDPERLPPESMIDDLPERGMYGYIEQVLSYYRTFPGEEEYQKLERMKVITRLRMREDLDQKLTEVLNRFYMYGDFAIQHNLQAFMIKDCSARALNVLLANKIPVFYIDGLLIGYRDLGTDGFCMFKTIDGQYIETFDLTHRKRMAILFIVPKPGKKKGVSKAYLENAIAYYRDEMGNTPKLIEIKESMFDISASKLE